eukprot:2670413-Pleurochrysis_carterae.AAC.1
MRCVSCSLRDREDSEQAAAVRLPTRTRAARARAARLTRGWRPSRSRGRASRSASCTRATPASAVKGPRGHRQALRAAARRGSERI